MCLEKNISLEKFWISKYVMFFFQPMLEKIIFFVYTKRFPCQRCEGVRVSITIVKYLVFLELPDDVKNSEDDDEWYTRYNHTCYYPNHVSWNNSIQFNILI